MQTEIESILSNHKLKKTEQRITLLETFFKHSFALAFSDIWNELPTLDKVTIYRTLHTFEKSGIIHQVNDNSNVVKYALCPSSCSHVQHVHEHAHFQCEVCSKTKCLENFHVDKSHYPLGFEVKNIQILFKGICNTCG